MDPVVQSMRPRKGQGGYSVVHRCLEEAAMLSDDLRSSAERVTLKKLACGRT